MLVLIDVHHCCGINNNSVLLLLPTRNQLRCLTPFSIICVRSRSLRRQEVVRDAPGLRLVQVSIRFLWSGLLASAGISVLFNDIPAFSNKDFGSLASVKSTTLTPPQKTLTVSLKTVCFHCWFQRRFSAFMTSSDPKHANLRRCHSSSFHTAELLCFDCSRCSFNGKVISPPVSGVTKQPTVKS